MTNQFANLGMDIPMEMAEMVAQLSKQAESARFSVYMCGLCTRKITADYTEVQRAVDCRREVAVLRGVIGDQKESEWIPAPLLARCSQFVARRK